MAKSVIVEWSAGRTETEWNNDKWRQAKMWKNVAVTSIFIPLRFVLGQVYIQKNHKIHKKTLERQDIQKVKHQTERYKKNVRSLNSGFVRPKIDARSEKKIKCYEKPPGRMRKKLRNLSHVCLQ